MATKGIEGQRPDAMKWGAHAEQSLSAMLENMVAESLLAQKVGVQFKPADIVGASRDALMDVIRNSLPLATIFDESDIVLHAEGPGVSEKSLDLSAVNWLTGHAESAIRKLGGSIFELSDRDSKRLSRLLDLRLTGFAPGGLYAGVAIQPVPSDLISEDDEPVMMAVREAVRRLPAVPVHIRDDMVLRSVEEVIPDPGQRDATMSVLYHLTPTGRKGIHTVEIGSPGIKTASLSQRERVVLRDAIDRPRLQNRRKGSFVGELREIDLDTRRVQLRHVKGVGSIRCIIGSLERSQAKGVLGETVRVSGEYETDREGRPRLMIVSGIEVIRAQQQGEIPGA